MNDKVIISKYDAIVRKLTVLAKEKESVRLKLAVTAGELKTLYETLEKKVVERTRDLQQARAKEETVLMSIGDGLLVVDQEGIITLTNTMAENLLGQKQSAIKGKVFSDVILMEDEKGNAIPKNEYSINITLATAAPTATDTLGPTYYYVRKDKTKFPVAVTVTPIIFGGKVIGAVQVFRNITREKEIDRAKSEFVSLASHQLKTPPTAIKLLTERMLQGSIGSFNEKQTEYLHDIRSSNQRMIDIVNALLNASRIELATFSVELKEKDVVSIVKDILHELTPVIAKKHIQLEQIYPNNSKMMLVDELLLRIIMSNLITNAIHYSADKGNISIECRQVNKGQLLGDNILLEDSFGFIVTDMGSGIPANQQNKIFTKFFRADNAREQYSDGTGLGLYLVKSIIDNTGGSIWFSSEENQGTTFYVTIPMAGMKSRAGTKSLVGAKI